MGRDTGPREKLSRREGVDLLLKGERSLKGKGGIERRGNNPPGQHGGRRQKAVSEFGLRLREKQKVKRLYQIRERQFRRHYGEALKMGGVAGENLLYILETRLDNVVYRLGFGSTRPEARQLVNHGHIRVNGKKMDIASYQVKTGDEIQIREKSRKIPRINESMEQIERRGVPEWLEIAPENYKGKVNSMPVREDITFPIEEQLIVEFYSRV